MATVSSTEYLEIEFIAVGLRSLDVLHGKRYMVQRRLLPGLLQVALHCTGLRTLDPAEQLQHAGVGIGDLAPAKGQRRLGAAHAAHAAEIPDQEPLPGLERVRLMHDRNMLEERVDQVRARARGASKEYATHAPETEAAGDSGFGARMR